jgi:hypothetical protein
MQKHHVLYAYSFTHTLSSPSNRNPPWITDIAHCHSRRLRCTNKPNQATVCACARKRVLKPKPKLKPKLALYLQTKKADVRASECVSELAVGIAIGGGLTFFFFFWHLAYLPMSPYAYWT